MVGSVESREVRLDLGFSRVWGRSRRKREDLLVEDSKTGFSVRKRSNREGKVCGKGVLVLETDVQGGNGAAVFGLSMYGWQREGKDNGMGAKIPKQGRGAVLAGSLWGEVERGEGRWVSWVSWEKETVLGGKWGNGIGRRLV